MSRAVGLSWSNAVAIRYLVVKEWRGYKTDREDDLFEPGCTLQCDGLFFNADSIRAVSPFVVLLRCVPSDYLLYGI